METTPATLLPATDKDLFTYKNRETGKTEQIDLRTGKLFEAYLPMKVHEFCNMTADLICQEILEGNTLKHALALHNVQHTVFYKWISIFPEFGKRYGEARKCSADYHFHRALELAAQGIDSDKSRLPGLKLAIETHKWAAEKSDPDRFGKPKEESNTAVGGITINLMTGVLDRAAPADIVVDQYGNFQGFGVTLNTEVELVEDDIILTQDRWEVYDGRDDGSSEESESIVTEQKGKSFSE